MRSCCRLPLPGPAGAPRRAAAAAALATALATALAPGAHAQTAPVGGGAGVGDDGGTLINMDTPTLRAPGALAARVDVRAFSGDENQTYVGVGVRYGLAPRWEGVVRAAFAPRRTFPLTGTGALAPGIRHGGSDVEVAVRYALPARPDGEGRFAYSGLVGVSFAGTPAQEDAFLTLGASASYRHPRDRAEAYVNPRAVLVQDNAIFGLGLGGRTLLADRLSLVAEFTLVVVGDNTRDTTTGRPQRRDLYGIALRYALPTSGAGPAAGGGGGGGLWDVEIGYTNGVGRTTGFGLTPALGDGGLGGGALYASFGYSR